MAEEQKRIVSVGGQEKFVATTGSKTLESATRRLNEIVNAMFEYQRNRDGDVDALITQAIASLEALAPRDEVESMLATQMITSHLSAMECLKRAALPEQTFEGRQSGLNHAHKLMALYLRQVETLDKHCGKGHRRSQSNMSTWKLAGKPLSAMSIWALRKRTPPLSTPLARPFKVLKVSR